MKKEEVVFLNQLIESLEDSEKKLEEAYNKNNFDDFNKIKKFMLDLQMQISKLLK